MYLQCKNKKHICLSLVSLLLALSFGARFSLGSSSISSAQTLSGNQTLVSPGEVFELGFFTPGQSRNYYIGIWYKSLPDRPVVWVANRETPVLDPASCTLELSEYGNLVLINQSAKSVVWSSNSSSRLPNSTVGELLDTGNFVIRDASDPSNLSLWESFDYPTDHWIPGSKVGYNKLRNTKQSLRPWRSPENPAPGPWSLELEPNGTSHLLLWRGVVPYWSSGEWNGEIFRLVPEIKLNYYVRNITFVSNENESYFTYSSGIPSAFTRFVLGVAGQNRQYVWQRNFGGWALFWTRPGQQCEVYAFCGSYGSCNQQSEPLCQCAQGFEPSRPDEWAQEDHSNGCVRKVPLKCNAEDSFLLISNVRFPANSKSMTLENTAENCRAACLNNCSCIAYAFEDGCLHWDGDLYNLQRLSSGNDGKNFYIRAASSSVPSVSKKNPKRTTVWVVAGATFGFLILATIVTAITLRMRKRTGSWNVMMEDSLFVFKYRDLQSATRNFSDKLGEGAFGTVFRGTLPNSTPIAVKTLRSLKQGEKQFRMELRTIGMIQHVNLVRLRGFCAEASHRILVFDYMPNGSLQSILFQNGHADVLDWKTRYNIAIGIARGITYLHEKCRDCIIHCDIKPENILLDSELNAKVADFGLAKLIGRGFSRVLTTMRGTRGYLAPEWIYGDAVTPKADVFSYGMLLFEIVSGRRNVEKLQGDDGDDDDDDIGNYFPLKVANLVSRGEDVSKLLDHRLGGNADALEVNRVCRVACWCIQDDEMERPTMGLVVQILEGVVEVGTSSVPQFLRRLVEDEVKEAVVDKENSSSRTQSVYG